MILPSFIAKKGSQKVYGCTRKFKNYESLRSLYPNSSSLLPNPIQIGLDKSIQTGGGYTSFSCF